MSMRHLGEVRGHAPPEKFDFNSSKMMGNVFKNNKRNFQFHTFSAVSTVQELTNICYLIL